MSKPQSPKWSAKDLHAIIAKRQEVMLAAGYPLPQGLLGKNTDSDSIPESADQEMLNYLAQKAEAVYDLWVGDALAEAVRVVGGIPEVEVQVEAFQLAMRGAPFDLRQMDGIDDDTTQDIEPSDCFRREYKHNEQDAASDSIAALSQP